MRAAVTGGTGFVGSHLVDALLARGDDVVCLVRSKTWGRVLQSRGCRVVVGDLAAQPTVLASLVVGADVVYHVAGLLAAMSEPALLAVNRDGTARLAEASRRAGVGRFTYVSSLAATGPTRPGHPLDEASPSRPVSPYGRSKLAGEDVVRAAEIPATIVRPPVVYGPGDRQLLRLFRWVRRGLAPLLGDGRQELSLVHAEDLAQAVIAAAVSRRTAGRVYHAAHDVVATQREIVAHIAMAMGRRPLLLPLPLPLVRALLHVAGVGARLQGRPSLLSPDKAEELLAPAWTCRSEALARDAGWQARIPLDEGLRGTTEAYRAAGWL